MQLASPLSTCDTTAHHFQDIVLEMQYWYVQEKKMAKVFIKKYCDVKNKIFLPIRNVISSC